MKTGKKGLGLSSVLLFSARIVFFFASCSDPFLARDVNREKDLPELVSEDQEIQIPENESVPGAKWSESTHVSVAQIAASQWGLSPSRVGVIADASDYPDTYQSGLDNGYNQQWSHAYIYDMWFSSSFWLWGDADEDFKDNLDGPLNGEGYNGKYAGYYYPMGDQRNGDAHLGYALHYIEDVCLVLHSTAPTSTGVTVPYYTVDMVTKHFAFEDWVKNNLTAGHRLLDAVAADRYYYAVTDPKKAIRDAAWNSCAYKGTSSAGYLAWKAYRDSGYPTGAGTGSAVLVDNTKKMLIASGRYAKGAIKYTLDKYGQWTSRY